MGFGWGVYGWIFIIRGFIIIMIGLRGVGWGRIGSGICVGLWSMVIVSLGLCSLKSRWIGTKGSITVTSTVNYPSFCSLVSPSASFLISFP
jgi:hypothetical protein